MEFSISLAFDSILVSAPRLEIRHQSSIHQILPGVMHAFPETSNLTLTRRGLAIDVPTLNLELDLTVLSIDHNIIPRHQVVLVVQSVTRRGIYVRGVDDARFAEVDELPAAVFTVRIFVNGLQRSGLFESGIRNYEQFFLIFFGILLVDLCVLHSGLRVKKCRIMAWLLYENVISSARLGLSLILSVQVLER